MSSTMDSLGSIAVFCRTCWKNPDEIYVDYNADLYGEYVGQLRNQLVAYLRADTSVTSDERNETQNIGQQVQFITTQMVNHVVYVDPMARERWLSQGRRPRHERERVYNQLRSDIEIMFRNILLDFQNVSDKIKVFRRRNNWNSDRDR
ncbi:hypothetical protein E1301_Tti004706 [Triplophysa tibetana]|uniref:Uncharacterized protein n=1 Tax=Triplophysa tibetana TaxID=1572043 RepID=A0A5A9N9A8_9TELE|nr:hypothetical protein E1301_Tti004706 [Triplophysa tibetana]